MSVEGVARNYAETLLVLAEAAKAVEPWAGMIDAVAEGIRLAPEAEAVLMSPRVTKGAKAQLLASALPKAPKEFVRFLQAVVKRGRQGIFREIADEYLKLVDLKLDRVRARVVLAREADGSEQQAIAKALTEALGKQAIATFAVDGSLLGGALVRVGDRVFDGSIKRRMLTLRRALLSR
ncbi:MAG TPA: ATP synthase F1 subunit delta [Gemmatimonadales bacterium]|nr:ATP synthase F1 subunit delta [Gemmatimonadales bacterium]